jgi:8-oxo-dGTP pyrophosphatase MutT (NUDIX family)
MEEVNFFDYIPEDLTYPDMCRELFDCIQGWLNLQSSAGELWDVYDGNRNLTGRLHRRGEMLEEGDYHLVVHIWIQNKNGKYLLTKRAPNKGFPNMWETTGGSALAGDDSLTAALRDVKEETGLTLDPTAGNCILRFKHRDHFADIWLFRQEFDLGDVILQEGETCDKMCADAEQIRKLYADGKFVPYTYLEQVLEIAASPLE